MTPTVSIVIPTFNGEAFLDQTLASVRKQGFADWEIIAVDDGSGDGTMDILRRNLGDRFRVLQQDHAGAATARQRGLDTCQGRYVVFLDHDDRLAADALERFVAAMRTDDDLAVAYGDRVFIDPQGRRFGSQRGPLFLHRPSGDVFLAALEKQFITTPGQACISVRHLAATGGALPKLSGIGNDWAMWCLLATQGGFRFVGEGPVLEYRQHPDNMTKSFIDRARRELNIDELEPTLRHVFDHPLCREKADAGRLATAERRRTAHCFAIKGDQYLSAGETGMARRYFRRSLSLDPGKPRIHAALALTFVPRIPGPLRRLMGNYGD